MILGRRLSAAVLALVLAVLPLALERCRTACMSPGQPAPQAATSPHPCHDAGSSVDTGVRMDPLARACGHSDGTQAYESVKRVAAKSRTIVLVPAAAPLTRHRLISPPSLAGISPGGRLSLLRPALPLNSPLRL
jgi:hypothetical protein